MSRKTPEEDDWSKDDDSKLDMKIIGIGMLPSKGGYLIMLRLKKIIGGH